MDYAHGGERGPVTFPVFKAGDSALRESNGGFDFHTPPPQICGRPRMVSLTRSGSAQAEAADGDAPKFLMASASVV